MESAIAEFSPDQLASHAMREFSDVADYFWKSMRFVENEMRSEVSKLEAYFPFCGDQERDRLAAKLRKMRWSLEQRKLNSVFPYLIANGNLFTCVSLFETYVLRLCQQLEKPNLNLKGCKGAGIERFFRFLRSPGIQVNQTYLYSEINAILRLRNCLYHANGLLSLSRDEDQVR